MGIGILISCLGGVCTGNAGQGDTLRYTRPVYFTANAGQWDASVRYGIVGDRSAAWFLSDGIMLVRPDRRPRLALETPTEPVSEQAVDILQLSFVNPSPNMRIVALDTALAVSHFYRGSDSSKWHTFVSNHRAVRYNNVWDGVDIEYREGICGCIKQTILLAPGADAEQIHILADYGGRDLDVLWSEWNQEVPGNFRPNIRATESGMEIVSRNSESGFHYKDTLNLTSEFNTALNFTSTIEGVVVHDDGAVTISGMTSSTDLPVRDAMQTQLGGDIDHYVLQYTPEGDQVEYCTYLGGVGIDRNAKPSVEGKNRKVLDLTYDDRIVGAFSSTEGSPLLVNSFQGFPILTNPLNMEPRTAYVYILNESGTLHGATYLGGPGFFLPLDLAVHNGGIYIIGDNLFDTLSSVIKTVAIPRKYNRRNQTLALARLSNDCTSLDYMTYVAEDTAGSGNGLDMYRAGSWGSLCVTTLGEAVLGAGIPNGMQDVALPINTNEPYQGMWVTKISAGGDSVLFSRTYYATIPGLSESVHFGTGIMNILPTVDGDLIIVGQNYINPDDTTLPSCWSQQTVVDHIDDPKPNPIAIWAAKLSAAGELTKGIVYGRVSGVGDYVTPVVRDPVCDGYLMFLWSRNSRETFYPVNAVDTSSDLQPNRYIISLSPDLDVRYATPWNSAYYVNSTKYWPGMRTCYWIDRHGYAYQYAATTDPDITRQQYRSWRSLLEPLPGWPVSEPYSETYLTRFRIYTPCWQVGCAISTIDTIGIERRRDYANPTEFTVDYAVTNHSPAKGARIVQAQIELPQGFELVSGSPIQPMTPAELTAGLTATCSWRVRVSDPSVLIDSGMVDTALIRCRVFYVDPESNQTYPMGEELCEKDIAVLFFDEPEPEMACTVEGPERLYWVGNGYAVSPAGHTAPARYTFTLTNLEQDTVAIDAFRYRAGPNCAIIGDSIRPGIRLAPGVSHVDVVDVEVGGLRYDRTITVEAAALDTYGIPLRSCSAETQVPGALDLPCAVTGTDRVIWNTASAVASPEIIACTLLLENPLDTIRRDVQAWADLAAAPHLGAAAGDSLSRPLFFIAPRFKRALNWRFRIAVPPSTHATDTIAFLYESDGIVQRCMHIVEIVVIDENVTCTLEGPDTHSEANVSSGTPLTLHYTLTNTGTVKVDVDRYELAIIPAAGFPEAGLVSLDPLVRSGGTIDPGNAASLDWSVRALTLREARTALCTVTAYNAADSVLSVCTHDIAIEGVDGLICSLTADDTVRFNRTVVRYEPDTVAVQLTLENLLDTEETNVEASIDLTQAPRFLLAQAESASKTLASIDSHDTASLSWKLLPQTASVAEDQTVIIRYRSDEMSGWHECSTVIHIEAWPEEPGIACETGGHDSLYADAHYERFIPDPLHVSYTVTNTGTVALTDCEASIILPSEFSLAGSDSTQSFTSPEYANQPGGPVPEGTLLPGASCSRWWKITPAQNIADNDPRLITWVWKSNEQGTESGCTHIVTIIPENPPSILLTPLHLYFEAERGGALPVEQHIQLWTGGGLAMPWTAQPSEWWLDAQPTSGSQTTQIPVQPNSTMLDVGAHGADLLFTATPTDRHVAIAYVIRKSTGIESPAAPGALTLDAWPQPVAAGARLYVHIGGEAGGSCRLTLHDLLGRGRLTRYAETASPVVLDLGALQLSTGVYLLRAIADNGAQATRMISVTGVR